MAAIGASTPPWARWLAAGLAIILALVLAVQALTLAMARHWQAGDNPEAALAWRPSHSPALSHMAELAIVLGGWELEPAVSLARRALSISPLDRSALHTLGLAADRAGQEERAEALMTIAAKRSVRGPSHLWLFYRHASKGNYEGALDQLDALMRSSAARTRVAPVLMSMAADQRTLDLLARRLAERPYWRELLIWMLARSAEPGLAHAVVLRLDDLGSPATEGEAHLVVRGLISERRVPEAYLAWVQTLPPEGRAHLGDLYDGEFEGLPGGPPFNWELVTERTGVAAEITRAPGDGEGALFGHFSSAKPQVLARQVLLLPAGAYRLSSTATVDHGPAGLLWTLSCERARTPLFELPAARETGVRQTVSGAFSVPEGCLTQSLELRGVPEGEGLSEIWVHDVSIDRAAVTG